MMPLTATAAAVSSATTVISTSRIRSTSTPRWRAGRSPRASRSSLRAYSGATARPTAANGRTASTLPQVAWESEPSCQKVTWLIAAESAVNRKIPISAPQKAFTATPVRISVTTSVRPPERAIRYTAKTVSRPVAKAKAVIVQLPRASRPSTMQATAPTAPPEETPITAGSASGLPNTPCISAPAQPSEPPTSRASTTRGSRTFHSTDSGTRSRACPPRPSRWAAEARMSPSGMR